MLNGVRPHIEPPPDEDQENVLDPFVAAVQELSHQVRDLGNVFRTELGQMRADARQDRKLSLAALILVVLIALGLAWDRRVDVTTPVGSVQMVPTEAVIPKED